MDHPVVTAGILFRATRPMFFPASAIPVLVGTAWGWRAGHLDFGAFVLALVAMACLHAGANVLNDVGDEMNGCDRLNHDRISPFTGGSRFLQDGLLTLRQMTAFGGALLMTAATIGLALTAMKGTTVLALGLLGGGLAIAYSLPPFSLASRGLGELAVAIGFGTPVAACAWLQKGAVSPDALLAAAAIGLWSAAILVVNEIPDIRADSQAGKRTLVVRLGIARSRWLYAGIQTLAGAAAMAAAVHAGLTAWAVLPFIVSIIAAQALAPRLMRDREGILGAIRGTLGIHLLGGLWLAAIPMVA